LFISKVDLKIDEFGEDKIYYTEFNKFKVDITKAFDIYRKKELAPKMARQ
jgi:hypothetical protein